MRAFTTSVVQFMMAGCAYLLYQRYGFEFTICILLGAIYGTVIMINNSKEEKDEN